MEDAQFTDTARKNCRQSKRAKRRVNYRQLLDVKLPRPPRNACSKPSGELFPVRIVERRESQVKVHYVGYSSSYDEWKDIVELEELNTGCETDAEQDVPTCIPLQLQYSLYRDLSIKIKLAMSCGRKGSPAVRISMSFDILLFNGGLKEIGIPSRRTCGNQCYKIRHYRDLNHLLGSKWHYRGLNAAGDYCYAVMETVEFFIRKSQPLVEYYPRAGDQSPTHAMLDTGYTLCFCFVCKYGNATTFGSDRSIFYE